MSNDDQPDTKPATESPRFLLSKTKRRLVLHDTHAGIDYPFLSRAAAIVAARNIPRIEERDGFNFYIGSPAHLGQYGPVLSDAEAIQ